jgi:hypothetical protein
VPRLWERESDPPIRVAMDDFQGLLARDFGLRPQGKAAPMAAPSRSAWPNPRFTPASAASPSAPSYDDIFGAAAPPKPGPSFDSIFDSFKEPSAAAPPKSMPVYDKPVYDDDIFDGVPGVKSSSARYDDVFAGRSAVPPVYDDLLAGLGKMSEAREESGVEEKRRLGPASVSTGFDDLIPGFGGSSHSRQRLVLSLQFNVHVIVGCNVVNICCPVVQGSSSFGSLDLLNW